MTSNNASNTGGQSGQPFKRPAPRQKDQPAAPAEPARPSGPLPMGPPPGAAPGGIPSGAPQAVPVQPAATPVQPAPGVQPGVVPGQFPAAQVSAVSPASAPVAKDDRKERGATRSSLLPLAVAGGVCLALAGIGLLVFVATRGDEESSNTATARVQPRERTGGIRPTPPERTSRPQSKREVVEGITSNLDQLPVLIDDSDVFEKAERGNVDTSEGPSKWFKDTLGDGVASANGGGAFDDRMPDADDLGLGKPDDADEPTETPEEDADDEPPVERPEPFTEMPDQVSLPRLPSLAGEAAPVPIGVVHKLESDDVTFLLGGASEALGSKGKFGIKKEDEPSTARVLAAISGQVLPVARLAVENEQLTFQWLADDAMAEAEFLRNCSLVVNVAEQSKALRLREPETNAPMKVSLAKSGASFKKRLKAVPSSSSLGLEIIELSEPFPTATFVGGPRLQPSTKKEIKLKGTSGQELLSLHVNFTAKRGGEVSIVAKPIWTDGQVFELPKALAQVPALQRQKLVLEAQLQSFRGAARTAAKPQFDRKMEAVDLQIAHYIELQDMCQQLQGGGGAMHFRVFLDVGGREIDLLTTKPGGQAGTDATTGSPGGEEDTTEKPPAAKETAKG